MSIEVLSIGNMSSNFFLRHFRTSIDGHPTGFYGTVVAGTGIPRSHYFAILGGIIWAFLGFNASILFEIRSHNCPMPNPDGEQRSDPIPIVRLF